MRFTHNHQHQLPLCYLVCSQQQRCIVRYLSPHFLITIFSRCFTSFWIIVLPVMAVIVPLFMWSDIVRLVNFFLQEEVGSADDRGCKSL